MPVDASWEVLPFSLGGTLLVKTGVMRFPVVGGTFAVKTIAAMVNTAPTGASVILDVKKNGTSIFDVSGNRPTIAVSTNAAVVGTFPTTTATDGDYFTCDIVQIGSTVAGADLVIALRLQRTS